MLTLLLGALDAASGGFEYEDVFRCLKTGLAGLSMAECDILENYALKWEIRGAMWTRETPCRRIPTATAKTGRTRQGRGSRRSTHCASACRGRLRA